MPQLHQRINQTIESHEKNLCENFIPSGVESQAWYMRQNMIDNGIPSHKILMENVSLSTRQNAFYSLDLIESLHKDKTNKSPSFIIITNSFHQYRSRLKNYFHLIYYNFYF